MTWDFCAKALMVAQSVIDRKSQELAAAQQTIADNAHKNDFFDNYVYCGGSLGFREVAWSLFDKVVDRQG